MNYKDLITEDVEMLPPKIIIYGEGGIGKTLFASKFPKPIIIRAENGAFGLKGVGKLPPCTCIEEFESQLEFVTHGDHDYRTLIIDPLDEVQKFKEKEISQSKGVSSIMDVGWGKGQGALRAYFDDLRWKLDLIQQRKMIIVLVAHYKIELFEDPIGDNYNFFTMNLEKEVWPKMRDWSDATLFVNYEQFTKQVGDANRKETKAVNAKARRIVNTEKRPAFVAKNRYSLPASLELYEGNPQATADELLSLIKKHLVDAAGKVEEAPKAEEPKKKSGKKKSAESTEEQKTESPQEGAAA